MKQYIIKGGTPLSGEVTIGGAKNAALGIIVAAIMADEPVTIKPYPRNVFAIHQSIKTGKLSCFRI